MFKNIIRRWKESQKRHEEQNKRVYTILQKEKKLRATGEVCYNCIFAGQKTEPATFRHEDFISHGYRDYLFCTKHQIRPRNDCRTCKDFEWGPMPVGFSKNKKGNF